VSASLLVEQRKIIFYNKTLRSKNVVLLILCPLHRYEAQKLSYVIAFWTLKQY